VINKNTIDKISETIKFEFKDSEVIFLSGSLIENIGNKFSDLDIFIIVEDTSNITLTDYDYNYKELKIKFKEYIGVKCDIEIYNKNLIEKNIEILNNVRIDDKRILNIFSGIETNIFLSFIHRMITGKCIKGKESYQDFLSKINLQKYFSILQKLYQNQIENYYDDLVGNFYKKNYMTTIMIGNMLLPTLIAYFLAKKEVTIDRVKWAHIKLEILSIKDKESKEFLIKINSFLLGKLQKEVYAKQLILLVNKILEGS